MKMNGRNNALPADGDSVDKAIVNPLRQRRLRVALQLLAAFMLLWISYGTDLADGIVYSRLILPPCNETDTMANISIQNDHSTWASSTTDGMFTVTIRPVAGAMNASGNSSTADMLSRCGGFGEGASRTAWVTSLATAFRVGSAFMAGVFVDTFGVPATVVTGGLVFSIATLLSTFATELYQLYITRGVIGACGSGILFASPIHGLAITFGEKISFAAGFTYMGAGVGAIVFGYAGKAIVAVGDWQWYYRMVSFVALLAIPSAFALFIKPAISIEDVDGKGTEMTDSRGCSRAMDKLRNGFICLYESLKRGKALYRDINFLLIGACYFFFALGYFFPFIASSHRLNALGIDTNDAYLQAAYVGFGTVAGSGIFMLLNIFLTIRGTLSQGVVLLVMGGSTILSTLATTENGIIAYNICYASVSVVAAASCGPAAREIVPAEMTLHAFGHLYLISFPAMAIGPPISGWIFDITQSYTIPLVSGGAVLVLAAVLVLIVDFRLWRHRSRKRRLSALPIISNQESNEVESTCNGVAEDMMY